MLPPLAGLSCVCLAQVIPVEDRHPRSEGNLKSCQLVGSFLGICSVLREVALPFQAPTSDPAQPTFLWQYISLMEPQLTKWLFLSITSALHFRPSRLWHWECCPQFCQAIWAPLTALSHCPWNGTSECSDPSRNSRSKIAYSVTFLYFFLLTLQRELKSDSKLTLHSNVKSTCRLLSLNEQDLQTHRMTTPTQLQLNKNNQNFTFLFSFLSPFLFLPFPFIPSSFLCF